MLNGVALILELSPFGDEALTTFLAAALNQVTACFGRHTGTEPVLVFTGTLGWLICPFHLFRLKNVSFQLNIAAFRKSGVACNWPCDLVNQGVARILRAKGRNCRGSKRNVNGSCYTPPTLVEFVIRGAPAC